MIFKLLRYTYTSVVAKLGGSSPYDPRDLGVHTDKDDNIDSFAETESYCKYLQLVIAVREV